MRTANTINLKEQIFRALIAWNTIGLNQQKQMSDEEPEEWIGYYCDKYCFDSDILGWLQKPRKVEE